jgi:signal transduction histidine kinase
VVVRELIENAVEHHRDGSSVPTVSIDVVTLPDRVTLAITDNGPGIPSAELRALDEGIETALTHTSGAGLWVVTWLVRLLDGDLEIDADPDDGTTVTIRFERRRSSTRPSQSRTGSTSWSRGRSPRRGR